MSLNLDLSGNDLIVNTISTGAATGGTGVALTTYDYANATGIGASSTSFTMFVNPTLIGTYQVAGASVVFGTASTSGTMQIEVATGTQAVAAGTNQLTGTMSLSGTANTTVNGTVIASPTTIAAGSRINVILAGTMTSLANCSVTVLLRRIS